MTTACFAIPDTPSEELAIVKPAQFLIRAL